MVVVVSLMAVLVLVPQMFSSKMEIVGLLTQNLSAHRVLRLESQRKVSRILLGESGINKAKNHIQIWKMDHDFRLVMDRYMLFWSKQVCVIL